MTKALQTREVVVLASGSTSAERNNRKGHLFEIFIAGLLHEYGYEKPQRENLNVNANGIELDIVGAHSLTKARMLAECKAYSSPVPARELAAFYGKLGVARLTNPNTFGFFVAVPGLSADGTEQARTIEAGDKSFRLLNASLVLNFLEEKQKIRPLDLVLPLFHPPAGVLSDEALLITEHGLYAAVKELDPATRLATRILVLPYNEREVPAPVLEDLKTTAFAANLPCIELKRRSACDESVIVRGLSQPAGAAPTIVEVTGSNSDFEYQFPASPKYFVGRKRYLQDILEEVRAVSSGTSSARVVVLNAQSGWGKSSFALKVIDEVRREGGFGFCIDSRTADSPTFVCGALRRWLQAAEAHNAIALPASASFASLQSALETLRLTQVRNAPLCLIFDQFENVFRDQSTTLEFRNLALSISELAVPVLLGFAWKTDFVSFTEDHPYQLRDDIRSRARVISLGPFVAEDVGQVLTRLQNAAGQKIHRDLREKLREYSQGLPWLLKKLANHILRELRAGARQEALIAGVLNVQSLFENDLHTLSPDERAALQGIARSAPVLATDAVELARSAKIVQSLLDQRLLVQIGERLDVYWDIFRDYLNRGIVPIEDGYILRLTPNGVSKLIQFLHAHGGTATPDVAAERLGTSRIAVFNMARDLRQLGILAAVEGALRFAGGIENSPDLDAAIVARAATALKRHRAYSLLVQLNKKLSHVPIPTYAAELAKLYPAVVAQAKSWIIYARAFGYWMDFVGLASVSNEALTVGGASGERQSLLAKRPVRPRGLVVFPRIPPMPVLRVVDSLARSQDPSRGMKESTLRSAVGDAQLLDLLEKQSSERLTLTPLGQRLATSTGEDRPKCIASILSGRAEVALAKE